MQTRFGFDTEQAVATSNGQAASAGVESKPADPAEVVGEASAANAEPVARLSAELEAALVRELRSTYAEINGAFFRGKLVPPTIELSDAEGRLGQWLADLRAIQIARSLVLKQSWGVVVEVLKHEMAHQWAHEVLGARDETAHGPAFRSTCEKLGIDSAAAGMPRTEPAAEGPETTRVLERVARLLALAESPNAHEAEAAMSAAQRLMLKYNLEQAAVKKPRGYGFRHLGKPSRRVLEPERVLAAILGSHFFVEVIWVTVYLPAEGLRASVLEVCGATENLEMADYVHGFLSHTAERLWLAHASKQRETRRRDRVTFRAGVMLGFLEKLNEERRAQKEEGLVWVKDGDLDNYYRRRHPHIRTLHHRGAVRNEAREHGRQAGRQIVLSKPVASGPTGGGRLLPPKR